MGFWRSLAGSVQVRIVTADPGGLLTKIENAGIPAADVSARDELTVQLSVRRGDLKRIRRLCELTGSKLTLVGRLGIYWALKGLMRRPVLVVGMTLLFLFLLYLPTRVLFIRVEGNAAVPARQILEQAARCGISFGTSRRDVRSERVKNALLEAMPQLQWAGVNTSGCVAVITVRERESQQEERESSLVSSIVAACDGVITECTVVSGNPVCRVGQAVQEGQTLISGYTDCGLSIRAERAQGEVYAQTRHFLEVISPDTVSKRGALLRETKKYSIIIGKNRINFYKGSGISDSSCVKMYVENYVTLPGGFVLPVAFVTEVCREYESQDCEIGQDAQYARMQAFAEDYLHSHMVAGQVLSRSEDLEAGEGYTLLSGRYVCNEMIGVQKDEEIVTPYGKYD